ncbi:MAG TPA: hypothetical protein VGE45_19635 [Chloroflexia bacterium]
MAFQPQVNQELPIDDSTYRIAEHPAAPGMPYGQEGRAATVYLVTSEGEKRALKVFKARFRVPGMVSLARRLAPYADLHGLRVCSRNVLTPQRDAALLRPHPDLTYAVLMPWIEGPTWMEVVLSEQALTPEQSLRIARSFAGVLAGMEQEGLAHCDLSGPNVLVPTLSEAPGAARQNAVELVDVEQLYGRSMEKPQALPGGSPGYAHKTAPTGMWEPDSDRFAGAVLVAEMLGWCDERVRNAAWGESYFDPQEIQTECERYRVMAQALSEQWGKEVAELFAQAWRSDTQADCATFGEWLVALPERVPAIASQPVNATPQSVAQADAPAASPPPAQTQFSPAQLAALFEAGRAAYARGDWAGAREMLTEVVRQEPEYGRDGQFAINMLHDIEKKLPPVQPTVQPVKASPPAQPAPPPVTRESSPPVQAQPPEYRVAATPPQPQPQPQVQAQTHQAVMPQIPTEASSSTQPYAPPVSPPQTYPPPVQSRSRSRMGLSAVPMIALLLIGLLAGIAFWFQSQSASQGQGTATATAQAQGPGMITATAQALESAQAVGATEANATRTVLPEFPSIISLTADPPEGGIGQDITIKWKTTGATKAEIPEARISVEIGPDGTGQHTLKLEPPGKYNFCVSNAAGNRRCRELQITIAVESILVPPLRGVVPDDPPGVTDFKLIPRPEDSYIVRWCITGFCSDALTATGTESADQDLGQNVIYHRMDESGYDADKLLAFYIDTLTKQGWTLDNSVSIGSNKGQILRPPAELKNQIRKVGIYFWSDSGGDGLNALTVAIIRQEPPGYPPDISLFVENSIRDGTAFTGSGPTPVIVSAGTPSPDDPPGLTDFKLVPRPADSVIVDWCITGFCSEGLTATGTETRDSDLTQHVVYRRANKSGYDTLALFWFYIVDLRAKGWTLGNNIRIGENKGQIFLPPENQKSQLRKIGIYFWNAGGDSLNALTVAIVRETPIGYPPDISLFVEDPLRDGTTPSGSGPTPIIGSAGRPNAADPSGLSDFKLVPRPADSNIVGWCVTGFCSEGLTATGTNTYDQDLTQHVVYHRIDEGGFDAAALLRFYIRDLKAKGWTLSNNIRLGDNWGYIFLPPENLKGQLRKIGIYFWSDGSGDALNACTIAIVRETPPGDPADLSLFEGH